jgi:hypothetical protein
MCAAFDEGRCGQYAPTGIASSDRRRLDVGCATLTVH